jgi:magnesium chelatase subunit D
VNEEEFLGRRQHTREDPMVRFPFTAIVGQEEMKTALILNVINPLLGGVLIRGQKGTAKSTGVRSLATLLPEIEVVEGCHFHCDPRDTRMQCDACRGRVEKGCSHPISRRKMRVVDLPLGATEDRIIGTLDMEYAIKRGETRFQPGILAEANRGILYVDEVNLLDDHLVDILLDVVASGINIVEREGISFSHPARLILVGTMNPEEGELRPQLLDRFGLCVQVHGLDDIDHRAAVIQRCIDFETDPAAFVNSWKEEERELGGAILNAREILSNIVCHEKIYKLSAQMALDFRVDGHRTDLFLIKTAKTLAAYWGRTEVAEADIQKAASLVLPHRMKKESPQSQEGERGTLQKSWLNRVQEDVHAHSCERECKESTSHHAKDPSEQSHEAVFGAEKPYTVRHLSVVPKKIERPRSGRRSNTEASIGSGRHIGSMISSTFSTDISFGATFRAAAPHQIHRDRGNLALAIECPDLRQKRKTKRIPHTILFLVDASGSMGANERMVQTKGAVLSLLNDAYKRRDRVGMVTFRGSKASVVLPPTSDKEKAKRMLEDLPVGGRTPLSRGLSVAYDALKMYALKRKNEALLLVVISDGKANVTMRPRQSLEEAHKELVTHYQSGAGSELPSLYDLVSSSALEEAMEVASDIRRSDIKSVVVDTASGGRRGQMEKLCSSLGGVYYKMEELRADGLVHMVDASLNSYNAHTVAYLQ